MDNTQAEPKTLAQMTAEVVANNEAHGWYENCATFPEAMVLLHSEVSEALEAWRQWRLRDVTGVEVTYNGQPPPGWHLQKPEGVGSEFADIFIQLLDDAWLFGRILEAVASHGRFGINDSFPANMNTLHNLISRASMEAEFSIRDAAAEFGCILTFLRQLCEEYGIDLLAEYERKMQYNRTRPYRHGNKRI